MAMEKTIEHDKIEVVGQYKAVQIREASVIKEDGTELTRSFHRYVLHPDSDISGETDEVKAICNAAWTDDVKTAWTEFQESQSAVPA
jgi:hypothetical protein